VLVTKLLSYRTGQLWQISELQRPHLLCLSGSTASITVDLNGVGRRTRSPTSATTVTTTLRATKRYVDTTPTDAYVPGTLYRCNSFSIGHTTTRRKEVSSVQPGHWVNPRARHVGFQVKRVPLKYCPLLEKAVSLQSVVQSLNNRDEGRRKTQRYCQKQQTFSLHDLPSIGYLLSISFTTSLSQYAKL